MLTIVLNGACDGDCQPVAGGAKYKVSVHARSLRTRAEIQALGVSYSGATYKFTVLDTLGRRVAQQGERDTLSPPGLLTRSGPTPSDELSRPGHTVLFHRSWPHKQLRRGGSEWLSREPQLTPAPLHRSIPLSPRSLDGHRVDRSELPNYHQPTLSCQRWPTGKSRLTSQSSLDRMAYRIVPAPGRLDTLGGRRRGGHGARARLCSRGLAREGKGETSSATRRPLRS